MVAEKTGFVHAHERMVSGLSEGMWTLGKVMVIWSGP